MDRRRSITALAALAAAAASARLGAQKPRIPRVAILTYGSRANFASREAAFMKAMAELGYEAGRNIAYEWRSANGQEDLVKSLAQELAGMGPDIILSSSTQTTQAFQAATRTLPIVMAASEDPVAEGLVRSLDKPGGNITGLSASVMDQLGRQVELLTQVAPRLTRVTALLNPLEPTYRAYRGRLQSAVRAGTRLIVVDASTPQQIEQAFPSRSRDDADGLIVMNSVLFLNERRTIAELAARAKRPAIYPQRPFVDAGGLMSWGPNREANFTRAAAYVDRILRGAKPADLPVEPAARLELAVSREAARQSGIEIPADLLKEAVVVGK